MTARLIAYRLDNSDTCRLVPAQGDRDWMAATTDRFARRCLPLSMANQWGWFVLNEHDVRLTWTGGQDRSAVKVELDAAASGGPISHFGSGIVTWNLPYLFRTSPGWNLLVRGPANWPKDGVYALEGLVETDWSVATFTVNWMLTRPNVPVTFSAGEPLCMLVPQRRRALEEFEPEECALDQDSATRAGHIRWSESRQRFMVRGYEDGAHDEPRHAGWQGHYFRGKAPGGAGAPDHQVKPHLRPFR